MTSLKILDFTFELILHSLKKYMYFDALNSVDSES